MNVPKLRFSEFNEALVRKTFEEVAEKIQDGTHFSPPLDEEGTCLYLTSKNIRNGFMLLDNISYISELEHKKIYKRCDVKRGDVLLTKDGASTGNCCINTLDSEFSLLSSVAFIRANANHHNNFIYQSIASQAGQKLIRGAISGQAITRITLTKLRNFKFYFPTLPEQQKIASFLSKVDEKIGLLSEKKDKLTEYKRGVMQQLFNGKWHEQYGQLTFAPPTLRFKADDGSEFPDWEEKRYSDIFTTFRSGQGITSSNIKELGEYPVYGGNGLRGYTSKYTHDGFYFLIGRQGALCGNINRVTGKNYISEHAIACKVDNDLGTEFYAQRLQQLNLNRFSESSAQPGLSVNKLLRFKVLVPCESEQAKIASFLLRLDEKVSITNSELEKAKEWKKGLLQQMFV
nr:type I restriction endonuclease subunit S [Vibrio splendidus]